MKDRAMQALYLMVFEPLFEIKEMLTAFSTSHGTNTSKDGNSKVPVSVRKENFIGNKSSQNDFEPIKSYEN